MDIHIRGHVEQRSEVRYAAVVCAIPSGQSTPIDRIEECFVSHAEAREELRSLTIAMGKRLREQGHEVLHVTSEA